jgi:D-Tyr-tRNAtyr deacylase
LKHSAGAIWLSVSAASILILLYRQFKSSARTKIDRTEESSTILHKNSTTHKDINIPKNDNNSSKTEQQSTGSVYIVVQRCNQASLTVDGTVVTVGEQYPLLNPTKRDKQSSCGLIAYVSFSASANQEKVHQAAKVLLNLPLLTQGAWGDGSTTMSVLDMAISNQKPYLLIVPQANLICKPKSNGKSLQYHNQSSKEIGKQLYDMFSEVVRTILIESQCKTRDHPIPRWVKSKLDSKSRINSNFSKQSMVLDPTIYSEWDSEGIPIRDSMGRELSKSARKKLQKRVAAQTKEGEKKSSLSCTSTKSPIKDDKNSKTDMANLVDFSLLDPEFCMVVIGTFGARQGLEFFSHMGPFCHVVQI